MNTNKLTIFSKKIEKYSPEILTGIGVAGMLTSTIMAVKATPKAVHIIDDAKECINQKNEKKCVEDDAGYFEYTTKLPAIEVIKLCWKLYIPSVLTAALSVGCLIGANSTNHKRNAALAAAYSLSENAFSDYRRKVIESLGEGKDKKIFDEVAKEKVEKNPVANREVIITENGQTLCYDIISGRYFNSDIETIRKAENVLNRQLNIDMYVSLNELYYELGLNGIAHGDQIGWNINDGLIELYFTAVMSENNVPCIAINYTNQPRYGFDTFI